MYELGTASISGRSRGDVRRYNHIDNQWQVIRADAREGGARNEACLHLNFFGDKYVVYAAHWKSSKPGALRNMVVEFVLSVVQHLRDTATGFVAGVGVEIPT